MNRWICMDCRNEVELDGHGRCGHCDSEAVDLVEGDNDITHSFSISKASAPSSQATA